MLTEICIYKIGHLFYIDVGIKSKALDLLVFVIGVPNAHKCRLMVSTKAKPRSSQMPGTGHPPMLILSDAVNKASNGAHNRRSLALTKAGSCGLAIDDE